MNEYTLEKRLRRDILYNKKYDVIHTSKTVMTGYII